MDDALSIPKPPSLLLLALEARVLWEYASTLAAYPLLRKAPQGDGHPLLIFPGLATGDTTTLLMRYYLSGRGFKPHAWKAGINTGRDKLVKKSVDRLREIADREGRKVSLIGWSLGGVFAREIAKMHPELVRQVITLGTPFNGHPKSTNAWRIFQFTSGRRIEDVHGQYAIAQTPPVPFTSIFSRSDGIVNWRGSLDASNSQSENIQVFASHCGMGVNPVVLYLLAERLAQPEGQWQPFEAKGPMRVLFQPHHREDK